MEQPQVRRSPLVMMALVAAGTLNCEMEGSQLSNRHSFLTLTRRNLYNHSYTPNVIRPRTSSAAKRSTAVKGACSGTLNTRYGSFGSEVKMTLKVTLLL